MIAPRPMDPGKKNDTGKRRYSLLPSEALATVVDVLGYGAKKYGDYNWRGVTPHERYYDAAVRHLEAWREGEWLDESGLPHLAHAACSILLLLALQQDK